VLKQKEENLVFLPDVLVTVLSFLAWIDYYEESK